MNNNLIKLLELFKNSEIFLIESPLNNYQPKPPKDWFALRSNKRRIFMRLDCGKIPSPEEIQKRIKIGEFNDQGIICKI